MLLGICMFMFCVLAWVSLLFVGGFRFGCWFWVLWFSGCGCVLLFDGGLRACCLDCFLDLGTPISLLILV